MLLLKILEEVCILGFLGSCPICTVFDEFLSMPAIKAVFDFLSYYANFYVIFLGRMWRDITPSQYGILLILISLGGYLLMRGAARK